MTTYVTRLLCIIALTHSVALNSFFEDFAHQNTLMEYEAVTAHDNLRNDELPDVQQEEETSVTMITHTPQETSTLMQLTLKMADYYQRGVTASGFLIPSRVTTAAVVHNNALIKRHLKEKQIDEDASFAPYNAAAQAFNEALELYKETAASSDALRECPPAYGPLR